MLFIAIGLIIFLISIITALVMLIRELGLKTNFDDSINDFPLDFAEELISEESSSLNTSVKNADEQIDLLSQDTQESPPGLDEVVPFPWEDEAENQFKGKNQPGYPIVVEKFSREQPTGLIRESLQGDFSVRDLAEETR